MSQDLTVLWARLSADEKSACERILACKFKWPQLQREIVEALGGIGSENGVALVESLIKKGVLKRFAWTRYLWPAVDLAVLVPPKKPPVDEWAVTAPRRWTAPPLPQSSVEEVEPEPEPTSGLDPERIIALVSEESQLPIAAFKGDSLLPDSAKWRGIAVYLIRTHCTDRAGRLLTHVEIGVIFSRGAPTIAAMYHDVRYLQEHGDAWYVPRIERLEQRLGLRESPAQELDMQLQHTWGEPQH